MYKGGKNSVSKCVFCLIYNNCILSVIVFVCHDKGNVFSFLICLLYSKLTSTEKKLYCIHVFIVSRNVIVILPMVVLSNA